MFALNYEILSTAKTILSEYKNIYWIIGGACSGKSTICKYIAAQKNIPVYNKDENIFGKYIPLYDKNLHPANDAWFSSDNPLDWVLSLSLEKFESLNKAANAEYLDLFAKEIMNHSKNEFLLVDGGISFPSVLSRCFPINNIVCLYITPEESRFLWENSKEREPMKKMILELPDGKNKWNNFLLHDKNITDTCLSESKKEGIKIIYRKEGDTIEDLSEQAMKHFGIN